jgi:hypothetical protein
MDLLFAWQNRNTFWLLKAICPVGIFFFILRLCELAMLAKANEEQAAIGFLPRCLRR